MSEPHEDKPIPRAALISAAVLIGLTIVFAATSKQTGIGKTKVQYAEVEQQLPLYFEDKANGEIDIIAANSGVLIKTLTSGEGGFIRGVMRGLVRERRSHGMGPDVPFILSRHADDRYSITDPATNRRIDLEPFGDTNINAFADLLEQDSAAINNNQNITMRQ